MPRQICSFKVFFFIIDTHLNFVNEIYPKDAAVVYFKRPNFKYEQFSIIYKCYDKTFESDGLMSNVIYCGSGFGSRSSPRSHTSYGSYTENPMVLINFAGMLKLCLTIYLSPTPHGYF